MKHATIYVLIGMAILGLCFSPHAIASEEKEKEAVAAAQAWLALIDEGKYGQSWETAALYFTSSITRERWQQMLTALRKPLGKLVSRELASKTFTNSLSGAPDGEYVVIQFKTSYQYKKSGIETVTPMLDIDDKWRVSGYYIK